MEPTNKQNTLLNFIADLSAMELKRAEFFKKFPWTKNKAADDLILDNYLSYLNLLEDCGRLAKDFKGKDKIGVENSVGKLKAKVTRLKGAAFKMGIV